MNDALQIHILTSIVRCTYMHKNKHIKSQHMQK